MVYLDNAATTKPYDEVVELAYNITRNVWENPNSLYSDGTFARKIIDDSRKKIADAIYAKPNEVVFTSSGSEANALAIRGFVNNRLRHGRKVGIITSAVEHHSIEDVCRTLPEEVEVVIMPVDGYCSVDCVKVEIAIKNMVKKGIEPNDILVSIMWVNNELGTFNDITTISYVTHLNGAWFHSDCVQAIPHCETYVTILGVDMMSVSAHKFHGIRGAGFLYVKDGLEIDPIINGSQEHGLRGGTENVAAIAAMARALEILRSNNYTRMSVYNQIDYIHMYFVEKLKDIGCEFNVDYELTDIIPTVISVRTPVSGEALMYSLDIEGIQVSTGSACNSKAIEPSRVLKAIGLSDEEAARTIRISFSEDISMEDIETCVNAIDRCIKLLQSSN